MLTRAGSRSHVENVEEETEAAVAHEMSRDRGTPLPEIIDLTEHKLEEETDSDRHSCRDGLSPLQLRTSSSRSSLHASSGLTFFILVCFIIIIVHYPLEHFLKKIKTIPQLLNVQVRLLLREAITPPGLYRELFPVLWYR